MNAISEFYNGNIHPLENMCMSREYYTASRRVTKAFRELEACLSESEKEHIDELREQCSVIENKAMEIAFRRGFSLGVRLTAACYEKENDE